MSPGAPEIAKRNNGRFRLTVRQMRTAVTPTFGVRVMRLALLGVANQVVFKGGHGRGVGFARRGDVADPIGIFLGPAVIDMAGRRTRPGRRRRRSAVGTGQVMAMRTPFPDGVRRREHERERRGHDGIDGHGGVAGRHRDGEAGGPAVGGDGHRVNSPPPMARRRCRRWDRCGGMYPCWPPRARR